MHEEQLRPRIGICPNASKRAVSQRPANVTGREMSHLSNDPLNIPKRGMAVLTLWSTRKADRAVDGLHMPGNEHRICRNQGRMAVVGAL